MYKINYKHLYFKYKKKFIHQGGANNNEDENYFSQINFENVYTFLQMIDNYVIFYPEKDSKNIVEELLNITLGQFFDKIETKSINLTNLKTNELSSIQKINTLPLSVINSLKLINKNTLYYLDNIIKKIIFVWKDSSDKVKIQYSLDIESLINMHHYFYTDKRRNKKDIKQNFFVLEKNSNNLYQLINAQRYINMIEKGIVNLKKEKWLEFKDKLKKVNIDKVKFYNVEKGNIEEEDILEKKYDNHYKVSKYQLNNLITRYNDFNRIKVHMDDMIIAPANAIV